jgi:hypothetical protein
VARSEATGFCSVRTATAGVLVNMLRNILSVVRQSSALAWILVRGPVARVLASTSRHSSGPLAIRVWYGTSGSSTCMGALGYDLNNVCSAHRGEL